MSNSISLYNYVKDIYSQSPKYHHHAIQPGYVAGLDLLLSLIDESGNVVLLSLNSTISTKLVIKSKVKKQTLKICLEFQYMEEKREKRGPIMIQNVEFRTKKRYIEISITEPLQVESHIETPPATNIDDESDHLDQNKDFDLDYNKSFESYHISKTAKYAELHKKIAKLMIVDEINSSVVVKKKCIHVLVEFPCRSMPKSTLQLDIFRYDKNSNLIVIVDDRNVEQVFGKKMANLVQSL
ncbi:15249_t:CDS:2, partial [Funneliformis geosporum]